MKNKNLLYAVGGVVGGAAIAVVIMLSLNNGSNLKGMFFVSPLTPTSPVTSSFPDVGSGTGSVDQPSAPGAVRGYTDGKFQPPPSSTPNLAFPVGKAVITFPSNHQNYVGDIKSPIIIKYTLPKETTYFNVLAKIGSGVYKPAEVVKDSKAVTDGWSFINSQNVPDPSKGAWSVTFPVTSFPKLMTLPRGATYFQHSFKIIVCNASVPNSSLSSVTVNSIPSGCSVSDDFYITNSKQ